MRLEINQFGGMAPLVDPTALADNFATYAQNVRLDRGVLAPGALKLEPNPDYPDAQLSGRAVRSVAKLSDDNTRFAFGNPRGAMAFVSPVSPADTWGRVYYMGVDGPVFTTSEQYSPGGLVINPVSYRLGVPAPGAAPEVMAAPTIEHKYEEGDDNRIEVEPDYVDVAYAYSFVDRYGHESSLSLASGTARVAYDRAFSVPVLVGAAPPTRVNIDGGFRRLYRATFDGSSSTWQFLADIPIGQTTFDDTVPVGQEGEEAVNEGWLPAPVKLRNLCLVASAFAAGYFDNYVCYSELKLPHAWPAELQYPIKYTPKGLMPLLNGVLIVTNGRPYWAEGSDPYSAIPRELPINAPCVSSESVVDMGDYAMYVSFDGLVAAGPGQAEVITSEIVDRAYMESLVDENCKAFAFNGRYVFSTKNGRWMGFVPKQGFVEYDFGYAPDEFSAVSFNVRDNKHFFAFSDGTVRTIDADGEATNVQWLSKHWRTPPASFSCFRVEAYTYPVGIMVRCQYLSQEWQETPLFEVSGPHIQRLPVMTGGLWQVVIKPPQGGRVYRVILGQSGREVQ